MTAIATGASPTQQDMAPKRRPEWLAGIWLIAPTLLIVLGMMLVPLIAIVIVSFWTQTGFELDTTLTLDNYALMLQPEGKLYRILIVKSLGMSLLATTAIVLLAYPMAYFMAFRIQRGKLIWIILLTVPFWTSNVIRMIAWVPLT